MRKWLTIAVVVLGLGALGLYLAADRVLASAAVRAKIEQQLTARLGQPVRIGSVRASLFPGIAVDLGEVGIGQPETLHLGRIKVLTGIRALFADTVDIKEIAVSAGQVIGVQPPFTFDLTASVLGDRLDVHSLLVNAASTTIGGRGVLTSIAKVQGAFDVRAERLDLNELMAIGAALAPSNQRSAGGPSSAPLPVQITVKTAAPRVRFGAYEFSDLSTTIEAVPSRFVLDHLTLGLFGGTFEGALRADTRAAVPVLNLTGALSGVDVVELLKLSGSSGGITGRLNATLALTGAGTDSATLLRSANGTIQS